MDLKNQAENEISIQDSLGGYSFISVPARLVPADFSSGYVGMTRIGVPFYDAELVYHGTPELRPVLYRLLEIAHGFVHGCNAFMCHDGGYLSLCVTDEGGLRLANVYPAGDFVTAQYYVFFAMSELSIRTVDSVLWVLGDVSGAQKKSCARYFGKVKVLKDENNRRKTKR